jgi:hypothetical protein
VERLYRTCRALHLYAGTFKSWRNTINRAVLREAREAKREKGIEV